MPWILLPLAPRPPGTDARLERPAAARGRARRRLRPRSSRAGSIRQLPPETMDTRLKNGAFEPRCGTATTARPCGWIERMPADLATQPRWRYWRARAAGGNTRTPKRPQPMFAEIAGLRDYYGYLAADRLHRSYNLNARPSPDDAKAQATIAADIGLIRAHELFACDMTDEAASEWSAALGGADPAVKVQAAHLASRWGWYAQSIATLAQAGEWDDVTLRYPRPYPESVAEAGKLAGVPAGLDTGGHAPGKPVSQGRGVARRCARPHANAAGDRRGGRAPLASAPPAQGRPVRSSRRRAARRGLLARTPRSPWRPA